MKKKLGYFLLAAIVIAIVVSIWVLPMFNQSKQNTQEPEISFVETGDGIMTDSKLELDSGILYTGKVVPVESRFYQKDPTKELNQLYVKEGDSVKAGDSLFAYTANTTTNDEINVAQSKFHAIKVEKDNIYTQLDTARKNLASSQEASYSEHLTNQIKSLEARLAEQDLEYARLQDAIYKLRQSNEDLFVTTDIDGFIYKIQNPNANDPSANASAYITILSAKRKVRISVSEYEYPLFKVGATVKVKIESTNQEFDAKITHVDVLPHNINTTDSSYYNVDIDIPQEVPYGYSAIITLPNNE